jgi:hypothetical protein
MSDLKKILKEEYAKKKLDLTPKSLMEMIYDELRHFEKEMIEEEIFEEEFAGTKTPNMERAFEILADYDVDLEQLKNTVLRARTDDRQTLKDQVEPFLAELGYEWQPNAPNASFGRFVLKDRANGNVMILLKPRTRRAADVGADYERTVAEVISKLLPEFDVTTAGFGAGSDLSISNGVKELKLELKTASGADFGQFKVKYNLIDKNWEPIRTYKFVENEELYSSIFVDVLSPYLSTMNIDDQSPNYKIKNDYVVGLNRMEGTREKKLELQSQWFDGKGDIKVAIKPELVQENYAKKGDSLIQIKGRGVYALTSQAADVFSVPELKDSIKKSYVRFRIKPHSGSDGVHSFTAALKISINRSSLNLDDDDFLARIESYLLS